MTSEASITPFVEWVLMFTVALVGNDQLDTQLPQSGAASNRQPYLSNTDWNISIAASTQSGYSRLSGGTDLERRLAAILAADVVSYSTLMEKDEAGTLASLSSCISGFIEPLIAQHKGRVVKLMGDGILAEFASAIDAVECAIAWQNNDEKTDREDLIQFRIGVNLGDIIIQNDDIFGHGVNIAARLEGLANPGGICVSEDIYRQVKGKIVTDFADIGKQTLKNVEEPVRVYRINAGLHSIEPLKGAAKSVEPREKPSIAVLPFDNMSGDPEQEYFADGISEDIITALSQLRWLFVIARNSTFVHKGKAVDIQQLAKELGVRYVLEGSVRRAGNRVRITTQLVDAKTAGHLWAHKYDRELEDIFALQDEITQTIVGSIDTELRGAEQNRARRQPTENLQAWDFYQQGNWHYNRITKDDCVAARSMYEKSIALDSDFALPYAGLAIVGLSEILSGYTDDPDQVLQGAKTFAEKAAELDDREALTSFALGRVNGFMGNVDAAIANVENAIKLNPSFASAYHALGFILKAAGRSSEALPYIDTAIKLSPNDPAMWTFYVSKSSSYYQLKDYPAAEHWARMAIHERGREYWPYLFLAVALVWQNRIVDAQSAMAKGLVLKPEFSTRELPKRLRGYQTKYINHLVEGLRKAGAPE
jgi:adenylate cyclase